MHSKTASWRSKTTRRSSGSPEISLLAILEIHHRRLKWDGWKCNVWLVVPGCHGNSNSNEHIKIIKIGNLVFLFPGIHKIDIWSKKQKQHLSLFFFCKDTLQQSDMIILFISFYLTYLTWHRFIPSFTPTLHESSPVMSWCENHLAHLAINVVFPEPLEPITP